MCSPPFVVPLEKRSDGLLRSFEGLGPAVEQPATFVGELVGPLRWAGKVGAPLGADEPLVLERAQQAVEVADVDPPLHSELRDALEQLVSVQRALPQEQQQ